MSIETIGPYQIQGILGRGGMGTVYRGIHGESGEQHAIKVLSPMFADNDHFRGRFESEIKALIKLNHRNIVKLLSYGQEDGMLFFSMELIEGNSLFQMQKGGHQFDWPQVISIARDCALGLRHAHDRGVIHRDLKPGNLLMAFDDQGEPDHVKLTDFGIAKRFGNSQNTGTNILGTMDFMSPEQARGEPVTAKSDMYSLGTVMFTLLSGRPPFTANSIEESIRNLTGVPAPRIRGLRPEVPKSLDDLIGRLMAKRPEDRIPTAQALLHQLHDLEDDLKSESEAQTAHGPMTTADTGIVDRDDAQTFQVAPLRNSPTTRLESDVTDVVVTKPKADATQVLTDIPDLKPSGREAGQVNFFNTVTDQIREKQSLPETYSAPKSSTGFWPVAIGLVLVVAVGGFGIYRATRPPSAESLYMTIESGASQPALVLPEIELFLQHYPEEPRATEVAKLNRVGEAVRRLTTLTNLLTIRTNSPGGLTEIEKQFLEISQLSEVEPETALAKMKAFVTVHQSSELDERDRKCIDAAIGYPIKLAHDQQTSVQFNLQQIRAAMAQANQTKTPAEAIKIYRSILELYGDTRWALIKEADEGRELLKEARSKLTALESGLPRDSSVDGAAAGNTPNP